MDQALRRFTRLIFVRTLRFPAQEEGAVMVEFVIVAPLFMFLVMASLQWAGIAHADAMLQYANFMSARAGAVHYEAMSKGWNDTGGGNFQENLTEKMEAAAGHAMGPLYRRLPGFRPVADEALSSTTTWPLRRVLTSAPTAVLDLRVTPGTVATNSEYLPTWMSSRTEVDLGLPFPWVGAVIELMFRNAATPTVNQAQRLGNDAFATQNPPVFIRPLNYIDFPFITMRSDAFLDTRNSNTEARWIAWPFNAAGNSFRDLNGTNVNINSSPIAHPAAYPIQARFR